MHANVVFESMIPQIKAAARFEFRDLPRYRRDEAVNDVVVMAFFAFSNLVKQGRIALAYPTPLAMYACRQYRAYRRPAEKQCVRDVLSPYAQHKKRFDVDRLDKRDCDGRWKEAIVEDSRTRVPNQVWFRLDFPCWLRQLGRKKRRIAEALAVGGRTMDVAKKYHLSRGRISQLRHELEKNWYIFQGECND